MSTQACGKSRGASRRLTRCMRGVTRLLLALDRAYEVRACSSGVDSAKSIALASVSADAEPLMISLKKPLSSATVPTQILFGMIEKV